MECHSSLINKFTREIPMDGMAVPARPGTTCCSCSHARKNTMRYTHRDHTFILCADCMVKVYDCNMTAPKFCATPNIDTHLYNMIMTAGRNIRYLTWMRVINKEIAPCSCGCTSSTLYSEQLMSDLVRRHCEVIYWLKAFTGPGQLLPEVARVIFAIYFTIA